MANGGQVSQWDLQAMARIHIVGASGAGTSTLGAALARRLGYPHIDADALFWMPTDPPFTTPRPADDRQALLRQRLPITDPWVFSGSALKWACLRSNLSTTSSCLFASTLRCAGAAAAARG